MSNRDRVAIIIAAGLASWGIIAIGCAAWRNKSLGEAGGEILGLIAGGLTAALTAYFTRNNGNGQK
jgi:energy-converting hydrogenase Eha subunit A